MSIEGTANTEYVSLSGKIRAFVVDKTLAISGACADAKATGDAIAKIEDRIDEDAIAERVQNEVDELAVKKTGDTMTGDLHIGHDNPCIYMHGSREGQVGILNGAFYVGLDDTYLQLLEGNVALFSNGFSGGLLHEGNMTDFMVSRVVSGTVTGSWTAGEDEPNSITFPFVPKLVIVSDANRNLNSTPWSISREFFIWMPGIESDVVTVGSFGNVNRYYNFDGNTLSWWMSDTAYSGATTGVYVAFG